MANLIDSLTSGIDTGDLDQRLGAQVAQIVNVAQVSAQLVDAPPTSVDDFVGRLSGLTLPEPRVGGEVQGGFDAAIAALPSDLGSVAGRATGEIGRFVTLIETELAPLLSKAVTGARAIEGLLGTDLRCGHGPGAAGSGGSAAAAEEPAAAPPAERLAAVSSEVQAVDQVLATLPSPLTAGALIDVLVALMSSSGAATFLPIRLPVVDDVVRPLRTVSSWQAMSETEVGTDLRNSLVLLGERLAAAGIGHLDAAAADVAALEPEFRASDLDNFASAYLSDLSAIRDAIRADDPATAAARAGDLDATLDGFETLRTQMEPVFSSPSGAAVANLRAVPGRMFDDLTHLLVQLEPVNPAAAVLQMLSLPAQPEGETAASVRQALSPVTDFLQDLAELLDFSALQSGIDEVAGRAQDVATEIENALNGVTGDVRAALNEVADAVGAAELDDVADEARQAIAQAGAAIERAMAEGFGPLREGLGEAIQTLGDAVAAVDAQDVVAALQDVVAQIVGVLQDPQVQAAIADIGVALDDLTGTLETLGFAPVTDQVIDLIDAMKDGLRAIESTPLNDALTGALSAAMAVLPDDLRPVTDPIIDDFGDLVESGPVELLEALREKPQQVLDRIRTFEPGKLIGDSLGAPYREALAKLDAFRPSALIRPANDAFEAEKSRLKQEASASRALAPLLSAFDTLLERIDGLSPDALLAPIEQEIENAIQRAVDASPVDEIFEQVNGVFATIEEVLALLTGLQQSLARIGDALTALGDADAQIDAWRDAALAKVEAMPNLAALTTRLNELKSTVADTRHGALLTRYDAAITPLSDALSVLSPEARVSAMVTAYRNTLTAARAMPTGGERDMVLAALDRLDPLAAADIGPLHAASKLAEGLATMRADLAARVTDWEQIIFDPDGGLAEIEAAAPDRAGLRALLEPEIDRAMLPVRHLLTHLGAFGPPLGAVVAELAEVQNRITAGVGDLLTGPNSLQTISDSVQQVVDTLRNIDVGFLREGLQEVFATVRGEIEALGPRPLVNALDREMADAIDAIRLDAILPQAEIDQLDSSYEDILETLRALDPETVVTEVVQPVFDEQVLPVIEALDVTRFFDALIAALRGTRRRTEG